MTEHYSYHDALHEIRSASRKYGAMHKEDRMVYVAINSAQREIHAEPSSPHLRELAEETCAILSSGASPTYLEAAYDIMGDYRVGSLMHVALGIIGSVLDGDPQDFGSSGLPMEIIREFLREDLCAALDKRFERRVSAGYGVWETDKALAELLSSGMPVAYVVVAHEKVRKHRHSLEDKSARETMRSLLVSEYEQHGDNDLPVEIIREFIGGRLDDELERFLVW